MVSGQGSLFGSPPPLPSPTPPLYPPAHPSILFQPFRQLSLNPANHKLVWSVGNRARLASPPACTDPGGTIFCDGWTYPTCRCGPAVGICVPTLRGGGRGSGGEGQKPSYVWWDDPSLRAPEVGQVGGCSQNRRPVRTPLLPCAGGGGGTDRTPGPGRL